MAKARLKLGTAPAHLELFVELRRQVRAGLVVCPFAFPHIMEMVKYRNDRVRREIELIVDELSGARCFKGAWDLVRDEVASALNASQARRVPVRPLGFGADCIVRRGPAGEQVDFMESLRHRKFSTLVESIRKSRKHVDDTEEFGDHMLGIDREAQARRLEARSSLADLRSEVRRSYIEEGPLFRRIVRRAGQTFGLPEDRVTEIAVADELTRLPTLRVLIEIAARRSSKLERPPDAGDPIDLLHLLALPYCDYFITERFVGAIASEAIRAHGASVHTNPRSILEALKTLG